MPSTKNNNNWLGTSCFIIATIMMTSPIVASTSITPWVLYGIGNSIWFIDSVRVANYPWACTSAFFTLWDILIIISRIHQLTFMDSLIPFLHLIP